MSKILSFVRQLCLIYKTRRLVLRSKRHDFLPFGFKYTFTVGSYTTSLSLCGKDIRSYLVTRHRQDHKIVHFFNGASLVNANAIIDIGANYGEFSTIAAKYFPVTFAVEANPLVLPYLRAALNENTSKDSFSKVVPAACVSPSWQGSHTNLYVNLSYSGGNCVEDVASGILSDPDFPLSQTSLAEVPAYDIISLTEEALTLLGSKSLSPNIAYKFDVEGYELELIMPLIKSIRGLNVNNFHMMFEYNFKSFSRSESVKELLAFAMESGFKIGLIPGSPDGSTAAISLKTFEEITKSLTHAKNCEFTITCIS